MFSFCFHFIYGYIHTSLHNKHMLHCMKPLGVDSVFKVFWKDGIFGESMLELC